MHEQSLSQAALPAPTRILGLLMRPYSLGHELHLLREQNPILSGGSDNVTRSDLAQAVLICSQTFEECRQMSFDWLLWLKLYSWRRRVRKYPTGTHVQAFHEYRRDGSRQLPASSTPRADRPPGRAAGAPFLLRLYQFIVIQLREPIDRAWDYPLGLAQMQFATYWEEQGGFDVMNEHDVIHDAKVRELDGLTTEQILALVQKGPK